MIELVAVRGELQLFAADDVGVIVDTKTVEVYDPAPLGELLAQDGWTLAETRDKAMVATAHVDLADAQLQTHGSMSSNAGRTFRVPKAVREAAAQGLAWREDPTKPTGGTPFGVGVARKLMSGVVSETTVRKIAEFHTKNADVAVVADGQPTPAATALALWGATPGAEWSARVVAAIAPDPVTASGVDEVGVEAPVDDTPPAPVRYFAILDPAEPGPTFICLGLLADDNGGWFAREDGEWLPTDAPGDPDSLALLDDESYTALLAQVDDPTTTTLELSISEARLAELALPELDLDVLDAVFAAVPYVDPQVRSQNASKQVRDANGKFIQVGARLTGADGASGEVVKVNDDGTVDIKTPTGIQTVPAESVKGDDAAPSGPKAKLRAPGALVPSVAARIEQYIAENSAPAADAPAPTSEPEFALGDAVPAEAPAAPPTAEPAPAATAPPGDTTAKPLYLAIVDQNDTQAVLDLVAVIPAEGGNGVEAYTRVDGAWTPADMLLSELQGSAPPPVVELDQTNLDDVITQMDTGSVSGDEPAPVAASGTMNIFTLTAAGELVQETVEMPAQLASYGTTPYPADIVSRLGQLAQGGADKNRGNAERLRRYWTKGEGAAKIRWGTDGDWTRCVAELSEHLGPRAKGYCTLRHHDALGYYPGELDRPGNPKSKFEVESTTLSALVGELDMAEVIGGSDDEVDPLKPHKFEETEFASGCELCGKEIEDPIHVPAAADEASAVPTDAPAAPVDPNMPASPKDNPEDPYWKEPHPYEDGVAEGTACYCGLESDDPIHVVNVEVPTETDEDPDPKDMPAFAASAVEMPGGSIGFTIPIVVPEGVESGDGRSFAVGALSTRDMPLALMWQMITDEGHKQSVIVGRIDHVEQLPEGGLGNASGVFDTGMYGQEALRLVRAGMLRGISADLDMFEANVAPGGDETRLTAQKMEITSARLMGATLVAKPAYAECTILLNDGEDPEVSDGIYTESTSEAVVAALVAAAAPLEPPKAWFENPGLSKPTHLTVTDEGRVFGHIAAWDVHHIGLPYGTRPPRSASNYAYFRTGALRTAEGEDVRVGQLTLWGGHAPLQADARTAVQHYDETKSAVCDLAAGEDRYGIWVSGALRPGVTPEQVRALRASSPSGDWRPIKGMLELVAVCQVNVPGFPIAQSMVAGGQVTALVAAGIQPLVEEKHERELGIKGQLSYIESAVSSLLADRASAAAARVKPMREEKQAALTASATSAKNRVDALRAERDAAYAEKVERAKAIVAALRVRPDFEEEKHLRDDEGKFRKKLAKLKASLTGPDAGPAAKNGLNKLEEAADQEDAGESEKANATGEQAADELQQAADKATGEVKSQLEEAAEDVREAVARLDEAPSGDGTAFDELPEALQSLIEDAVDKLEQQINPADLDALVQKVKNFISGTNPMSATEILNFLKRQVEQETTNKVTP